MPKPPIGLKPRKIVEDERICDIVAVISSYLEVRRPIPIDWITEYNELAEKTTHA